MRDEAMLRAERTGMIMKQIPVGVIGAGGRGSSLVCDILCRMEDLHIVYLCDLYEDRVEWLAQAVEKRCGYRPKTTTDYRKVIDDPAVKVILNYSAWETHVPIAIAAMKAGKPCGFEVGGAYSLQQCWDLVRTYEETGVPCMMLENCCYDKRETMILNMVRKGLFGEIVHCEGGYRHDLRNEVAYGVENRHYRLRNYLARNSHNYPTHDFGPIAKILDINRGNRVVSLCSMASKSVGLSAYVKEHKPEDAALRRSCFAQGDVVTTIIKCARGETITLHLDTTLPRFYSRDFTVQGTKGMYSENGDLLFLDGISNHDAVGSACFNTAKDFEEAYLSPTWKAYRNNTIGGHGGMDWLVHKAFFDVLRREETEMPVDVYDAATWMAITTLSEASISLGSVPMEMPDFTNGAWTTRPTYDVETWV